MEIIILLLSCLIKTILSNTKPSTDFDVHRNWKDITTSSSTIDNWYYDTRSEWTLDYPPLFAYLEFILGSLANYIDNKFNSNININFSNSNSNITTNNSCLFFHRITVILLGDITLYLSLKK